MSNGGMRPHVLVGIENTQRRRDMTGPTEIAEDRKIAPVVGGSAAFRRFIRDELMPAVRSRYRTTGDAAIMGESLAGLFAVESFLSEPGLFKVAIAIDPSLWWNNERLVKDAAAMLNAPGVGGPRELYVAFSNEPAIAEPARRFAAALAGSEREGVKFTSVQLPEESHATIYHPAAITALRRALGPATLAKWRVCARGELSGSSGARGCMTTGIAGGHSSIAVRRRRLLVTTLTLLMAIAALAMMGERSQPVRGNSTPAAMGMPTTL